MPFLFDSLASQAQRSDALGEKSVAAPADQPHEQRGFFPGPASTRAGRSPAACLSRDSTPLPDKAASWHNYIFIRIKFIRRAPYAGISDSRSIIDSANQYVVRGESLELLSPCLNCDSMAAILPFLSGYGDTTGSEPLRNAEPSSIKVQVSDFPEAAGKEYETALVFVCKVSAELYLLFDLFAEGLEHGRRCGSARETR